MPIHTSLSTWSLHVQTAASVYVRHAASAPSRLASCERRLLQETREQERRRPVFTDAAVDIRARRLEFVRKSRSFSPRLQAGAIDLLLSRDVNSIANTRARERKTRASSGPSEKVLIIWLSSRLLMGGYFWEPRINWAPEKPAYYLPIEELFPAQRN